jgi:hypothetical protein
MNLSRGSFDLAILFGQGSGFTPRLFSLPLQEKTIFIQPILRFIKSETCESAELLLKPQNHAPSERLPIYSVNLEN